MTAVGPRCHILCMYHLICLFVILHVVKETLLTEFRLHSASQRISFQWAETEFPHLNAIAKNLTNWTRVSVLLRIIYCTLIVTHLNTLDKWIKSQFSSSFIQFIRWFHFRKWGSRCNSFCIKWAVHLFMQGVSIGLALCAKRWNDLFSPCQSDHWTYGECSCRTNADGGDDLI